MLQSKTTCMFALPLSMDDCIMPWQSIYQLLQCSRCKLAVNTYIAQEVHMNWSTYIAQVTRSCWPVRSSGFGLLDVWCKLMFGLLDVWCKLDIKCCKLMFGLLHVIDCHTLRRSSLGRRVVTCHQLQCSTCDWICKLRIFASKYEVSTARSWRWVH